MSQLVKENQENFKWGDRLVVSTDDSDVKIYKSFTYQGVLYSLFDCAVMYRDGAKDTDIGKLVKIWESKKGARKGKVVWFYRPIDVCHYLRDYEPSWNELFLASGEGIGVSNIIPLEAIVGKCIVVCSAKDSRNTQLPKSDLGKANFYFSHIFDVKYLRISDKFPDSIAKVKVERLLNSYQDRPKANMDCGTGPIVGARMKVVEKPTRNAERPIKAEILNESEDFDNRDKPKAKVEGRNGLVAGARLKVEEKLTHAAEKPTNVEVPSVSERSENRVKPKANEECRNVLTAGTQLKVEVSSLPEHFEHHNSEVQPLKKRKSVPVTETNSLSSPQDTRRWFSILPWGERLKDAHENGTLVHLVNLDPSYTSSDVQDIILKAFEVKADAKIIPCKRSFEVYGQALVIFESKGDADFVKIMLQRKCLFVGEGRPLVVCKSYLNDGVNCNFPGHLIMDKQKHWSNKMKRKVESTSHCSQANTVEHEMAMQWRALQKKSDLWWEALHEEQAKEISQCLSQMMKNQQTDETFPSNKKQTDETNGTTKKQAKENSHYLSQTMNNHQSVEPHGIAEMMENHQSNEAKREAESSAPESPVERPLSAPHQDSL